MWTKLSFPLPSITQHHGKHRIHCEGTERTAALTEASNEPTQVGLRALGCVYIHFPTPSCSCGVPPSPSSVISTASHLVSFARFHPQLSQPHHSHQLNIKVSFFPLFLTAFIHLSALNLELVIDIMLRPLAVNT